MGKYLLEFEYLDKQIFRFVLRLAQRLDDPIIAARTPNEFIFSNFFEDGFYDDMTDRIEMYVDMYGEDFDFDFEGLLLCTVRTTFKVYDISFEALSILLQDEAVSFSEGLYKFGKSYPLADIDAYPLEDEEDGYQVDVHLSAAVATYRGLKFISDSKRKNKMAGGLYEEGL